VAKIFIIFICSSAQGINDAVCNKFRLRLVTSCLDVKNKRDKNLERLSVGHSNISENVSEALNLQSGSFLFWSKVHLIIKSTVFVIAILAVVVVVAAADEKIICKIIFSLFSFFELL
jgi:hypothetical protein